MTLIEVSRVCFFGEMSRALAQAKEVGRFACRARRPAFVPLGVRLGASIGGICSHALALPRKVDRSPVRQMRFRTLREVDTGAIYRAERCMCRLKRKSMGRH